MSVRTFYGAGDFYLTDASGQSYRVIHSNETTVTVEATLAPYVGPKDVTEFNVISDRKISGQAGAPVIDPRLIAAVLGESVSSGMEVLAKVTVSSSSTTVPTGSGFVRDYGVVDASGRSMVLTASDPAVGSYSRSGSLYTFNASEPAGSEISYTHSTGSGYHADVTARIKTLAPTFTMFFQGEDVDGKKVSVKLNYAVVSNLSDGFSGEWSTTSLSFEGQGGALGVGTINWEA